MGQNQTANHLSPNHKILKEKWNKQNNMIQTQISEVSQCDWLHWVCSITSLNSSAVSFISDSSDRE